MDNENQPEICVASQEISSETESCHVQETDLKVSTDSSVTETELSSTADENTTDGLYPIQNDQLHNSQPSHNSPPTEIDSTGPNDTNPSDHVNADSSPHSVNSDGSQREITLDPVDDNGDFKDTYDANVVHSSEVLESNPTVNDSEDVENKKDASDIPSSDKNSKEDDYVNENLDNTINELDCGLPSAEENIAESVDDNEHENLNENNDCNPLSTEKTVEEISNSDEKDDGNEADSGNSSIIDTSIFPGPPADKNKVVVANCFELGGVSKSISEPEASKRLESSTELNLNSFPTFPTNVKIPEANVAQDDMSAHQGPSDDREDISDEEFDVDSSSNAINSQPLHDSETNLVPSAIVESSGLTSESFVHKSDNASVNSSDVGDIIDLKLEDAALKSIGSSCDTEDNRQSKVSNEDLEAVSDDELPNPPQVSDIVSNQHSTILLDDREEVSSSEDEDLDRQQNLDVLPVSSGYEFPGSLRNEMTVSSLDNLGDEVEQIDSRMKPLEAEPISDEEDNNMANEESKQASFDDGEAGEIKSPALGSPISEQGDLMLGEVEPVSADESPDTDGEIPSGDEIEKGVDELGKNLNVKNFESIDSDDDDITVESEKSDQRSSGRNQRRRSSSSVLMSEEVKKDNNKGEYMETISDEENLDGEDSDKKEDGSSHKGASLSAMPKESQIEKGHIPTSFNEHQVELDYEENYGDDGDGKTEMKEEGARLDSKPTAEDEEQVQEDQGLASDKDEGELSDDDCEEGEIKEPGNRKMFVKPICRFFQRGNCTWGINCRFLHPGVNDKGNYQMIEIPGFKPVGIRARLGVPGQWTEQQPPQEEVEELPPPPMPDVPHVETAWERGLRIAKEQRKKASERKEQEPDFEEKRLNLSVDEERELNKENERTPKIIPKDPYYDQQAFEVDEYYKIPRDPWHTGHYENFEVRYHQENSYSPAYRQEKPPAPPMRYTRPLSPPIDKFGRHREDRPEPERHEPLRVSDYPPVAKHPDEWIDPWRRSKSPKQRKPRSRSRGRRTRRSVSDSSDSSRSSHSSSGSSRSSRSGSGSSGSSSRSKSPEPAPPGVDRMDRQDRYGGDQPRSMVSVRGHDGHRGSYNNRYDNNRYQRGGRMYNTGGNRDMYKPRQDYMGGRGDMGGSYYNNNYSYRGGRGGGGMGNNYNNNNNIRDPRDRDMRYGRKMSPSRGGRGPTPDRPLPYARPPRKSRSSSRSSSSRSRSRSRSKSSDSSRSRSSSNSSRSSSSSSSSGGSADSEHLYRDLGSPSKNARHPGMASGQKKRPGGDSRKDRGSTKANQAASGQSATRHPPPSMNLERIPPPRSPSHNRADPKYSQIPLPPSGGRADAKYASRNAPQPPVKAKDPLKVVGQKSNIKLTLLPKQQQQSGLGDRPNPLASPPHKRRMSDRDASPPSPPPAKRPNAPLPASGLRVAADKAAKLQLRQEKAKSPPAGSLPPPPSSSITQRSKNPPLPPSPQKQPSSKLRTGAESASSKPAAKAPSSGSATSNPAGTKSKKSMSSRREELLKQLKAVEDAIARKKFKMS